MRVGRLLEETGHGTERLRALLDPINPDQLRLRAASPLMRWIWGEGVGAMTVGKLILVDPDILNGDKEQLARLTLHELIHVRQWGELGWFGFSRRYLADYLKGRRRGLSHRQAYLEIGLEVEARTRSLELI